MAWSILIEDIPAEGLDLKKEERASYFGLENNDFVYYTEPISVSLKLEKEGRRVRVNGNFSLRIEYACVRCLNKFFKEINSSIDTVYEPGPLERRDGETYSEETIDLGEEVRQGVILSLSVKPLCREDCRGFCPYCGQNVNQGSCSCRIEKPDPRFSKLKFFQDQRISEKGKENINGCSQEKTI